MQRRTTSARPRATTRARRCPAIVAALCASLALTAPTIVAAAPPKSAPPDGDAPDPTVDEEAARAVDLAIEAWRAGRWTEVRDQLEPLVREGDGIADPLLREQALRYLAEATLYDQALDPADREGLARGYIERLLDDSSAWTPPSGLHGRAFYDLAAKVRAERDAQAAEACQGKLLTCEADLTELQADYQAAIERYDQLQADFDAQLVERTQVIQRNRGLALLPFGVGHFTNNRYAVGGTFLGLEAISGAIGLGLLLYRQTAFGCVRTAGFQPRSLVCTIDISDEEKPAYQDKAERLRNAEAAMGYVFIGLVVLDVTLAQVLFKRFEVVSVGEVPRSQLTTAEPGSERNRNRNHGDGDGDGEGDSNGDPAAAAPGGPADPPAADPEPSAKLRLRPSTLLLPGPGGLPSGGGLGLTLEF